MALKKYAVFSGRARRKEYWMFTLFNFIAIIIATVLDSALGTNFGPLPYGIFYLVYVLGVLVPGISVAVRRLHDIGKSGGWVFIAFVPIVGGIWLLVLFCTEGDSGTNEYGPDPKDPSNESSLNNEALDSHLTT